MMIFIDLGTREHQLIEANTLFGIIQTGRYRQLIENVNLATVEADPRLFASLFQSCPRFCASGLAEFNGTQVGSYTGVIPLEIPIYGEKLDETRNAINNIVFTYASFVNAWRSGFIILILSDGQIQDHSWTHLSLSEYYQKQLSIKPDSLGQNPRDLIEISHDPELFVRQVPIIWPGKDITENILNKIK